MLLSQGVDAVQSLANSFNLMGVQQEINTRAVARLATYTKAYEQYSHSDDATCKKIKELMRELQTNTGTTPEAPKDASDGSKKKKKKTSLFLNKKSHGPKKNLNILDLASQVITLITLITLMVVITLMIN